MSVALQSRLPATPPAALSPDPYVDYSRTLTAEGGVLFVYKDLDLRWRYVLWRFGTWIVVSLVEAWFLWRHTLVQSGWITLLGALVLIGLNWLIVSRSVMIYRRLEIRPDCLILEGSEVFRRRLMEAGLPGFEADEDGSLILRGIYGSRLVEYATVRRFDENDRMPEVFAAQFKEAVDQLWTVA